MHLALSVLILPPSCLFLPISLEESSHRFSPRRKTRWWGTLESATPFSFASLFWISGTSVVWVAAAPFEAWLEQNNNMTGTLDHLFQRTIYFSQINLHYNLELVFQICPEAGQTMTLRTSQGNEIISPTTFLLNQISICPTSSYFTYFQWHNISFLICLSISTRKGRVAKFKVALKIAP